MSDEILSVTEIAGLQKMPAFESCGQWRIRRVDLDSWVEGHPQTERANDARVQ